MITAPASNNNPKDAAIILFISIISLLSIQCEKPSKKDNRGIIVRLGDRQIRNGFTQKAQREDTKGARRKDLATNYTNKNQ